ncbi:uncharacterized protein LOC101860756 [Aplysia californica]|uniref:Uncharacterized protein LOC101860756 n=1 Tax=Aplysia californica TaxID=6500 RepID=A0ABM0JXT3_APLCA|nr:uncharacterized protein LOC101860756 [Aplysia californica]
MSRGPSKTSQDPVEQNGELPSSLGHCHITPAPMNVAAAASEDTVDLFLSSDSSHSDSLTQEGPAPSRNKEEEEEDEEEEEYDGKRHDGRKHWTRADEIKLSLSSPPIASSSSPQRQPERPQRLDLSPPGLPSLGAKHTDAGSSSSHSLASEGSPARQVSSGRWEPRASMKQASWLAGSANSLVAGSQSDFESLPTVRAIAKGDNKLLLECLKQGENPLVTCPTTGRTLLHVVCEKCQCGRETQWVPMVYQLSNAGAELNAVDQRGDSLVRVAITRRLVEVLAALLKCGAEVLPEDSYIVDLAVGGSKSDLTDVIRRLTPSYWTSVHDAVPFKVRQLVRSWCRVNVSRGGQSLVEYTRQIPGETAALSADLMVQHEASIELAHAVLAGDADRARGLLCHQEADIHTCDRSVRNNSFESMTPMNLEDAAARYHHSEVLLLLKKEVTERRRKNSQQATPTSASRSGAQSEMGGAKCSKRGRRKRSPAYHSQQNVTSKMCVIS